MIKKIVAFGCSWTAGDELVDPILEKRGIRAGDKENTEYRIAHSYPGLIAKHYGFEIVNKAVPNDDLCTMYDRFFFWLKTQSPESLSETLILVGLSDNVLAEGCEYEDVAGNIDSAAKAMDLNLIQFNVLAQTRMPKLDTFLDATSIMEVLVIRNKPRSEPLFKPYKHPNENGHAIIAEHLIKKIDSVIIT